MLQIRLYMCAKMYVHGCSWQLLFVALKTWEQAPLPSVTEQRVGYTEHCPTVKDKDGGSDLLGE